ncbi:enoyl-CoA hydratase-related protein [Streptomyces sp. NPDC005279]|uniref:enoyl-CoA hydratase-related protein n=1 Tax=Streptomyces sp. NPDC005279 TaxID=3364712 RepID=UPI0036C28396
MTGAPDELVLAEHRGPVLVLTFNWPSRLTARTDELEDRYFTLLDAAEEDPDIRAVLVTGAGRGFRAGADLQRLQAVGEVSGVMLQAFRGADFVEGVASHLDKRPPNFPSLPIRSSDVAV